MVLFGMDAVDGWMDGWMDEGIIVYAPARIW
jgi:hypothetical protein